MVRGTRSLRVGELLSVLGELYRDHETGTLVLQGAGTTKYLYIQDGQVIFAASNAPEDKFTHILTVEGKLSPEQLQMATEKKGDRTIGKTLVDMGFLSSADLLEALVRQVYRVAESTLAWPEGTATFKPNVLPAGVAKLPLATPRFLLDVAQAVQDRAWVGQVLSGMETVIHISSVERDAAAAIALQPDERKLLDLVDGRRSVRVITEQASADLFRGAKFFLGLSMLGLVHSEGLLSHPDHGGQAKSLDLSFLDSMMPNAATAPAPEPPAAPPVAQAAAPPPPPRRETLPAPEPPAPAPAPPAPDAVPMTAPLAAPPLKPGIKVPPKAKSKPQLFEELAGPPSREILPTPESFRPVMESVSVSRKRGGNGKMIGLVAAAVVVVGGACGAGWWWYAGRTTPLPKPLPPVVKAPKPTPVATPPANPQAPLPAPTGLPDGVQPSTAPTTAPAGTTPTALPNPVPAKPEPAKPEPAKPEPAKPEPAKPEPAKPEPPKPEPPKPAPVATGASRGEGIPAPEARGLLAQGQFHEAAGAFAYVARSQKAAFTINIEVACQTETIQKGMAAAAGDDSFFVLPYDLKGRSCFVVLWGLYPDRPSAEAALAALPEFFRKNAQPRVVPWSTVKK